MLFYTKKYVKSTNIKIVNQLKQFNLFTKVKVYASLFNISRGHFSNEDEPSITLFQISLTQLIQPLFNSCISSYVNKQFYPDDSNICDVLRHEYGHAYSASHIRYKGFKKGYTKIFGEFNSEQESQYDSVLHISEYSSLKPDDDFAECFMYFLKWNGHWRNKNLPGKEYINGIFNKMKFIESLI